MLYKKLLHEKRKKMKEVVKEVPGTVVQMGVFAEEKAPIRCDYILHREINYVGLRS